MKIYFLFYSLAAIAILGIFVIDNQNIKKERRNLTDKYRLSLEQLNEKFEEIHFPWLMKEVNRAIGYTKNPQIFEALFHSFTIPKLSLANAQSFAQKRYEILEQLRLDIDSVGVRGVKIDKYYLSDHQQKLQALFNPQSFEAIPKEVQELFLKNKLLIINYLSLHLIDSHLARRRRRGCFAPIISGSLNLPLFADREQLIYFQYHSDFIDDIDFIPLQFYPPNKTESDTLLVYQKDSHYLIEYTPKSKGKKKIPILWEEIDYRNGIKTKGEHLLELEVF